MLRKITKLSFIIMVLLAMFAYSALAADAIYQSEDADFGSLVVETEYAGYTGSGYVNLAEGPKIEWKVNAPEAKTYTMIVRYLLPNDFGTKNNNVIVNGTDIGEKTFPTTGTEFKDKEIQVNLQAGDNTIGITKNWGWIFIDYISIVGAGSDSAPAAESNPQTGDAGLAPFVLMAAVAGVALVVARRKKMI